MAFKNVKACRDVIRGHEGEFLTMLLGNPSLYMIPNSGEADLMVDILDEHDTPYFVAKVGQFLIDEVEVV